MHISVIIPAHNAASTMADTLQSLLDQTYLYWDAIVIDDGSTDNTAALAKRFAEKDVRFRVFSQPQLGVSIARNNGVAQARCDWLLFLDADDWIFPQHLERLIGVLKTEPRLDAVCCGWTYVTPDGEQVFGSYGGPRGDLFAQHAQYCFSVIHTYIVRRSLVEAVGGFDPGLRTCEDWDLWQRIARTGARFGAVREKLAAYRIRAGSATSNGYQILCDGLQVLARGHGADRRIPQAHPVYPAGFPRQHLAKNKFGLLCACAGYVIGNGGDACALFEILQGEYCSTLSSYEVAVALFVHTMVAASQPRPEWYRLWPTLKERMDAFLLALEGYSGTPKLRCRTQLFLSALILKYAQDPGLGRLRSLRGHVTLSLYEQMRGAWRTAHRMKRFVWAHKKRLTALLQSHSRVSS
jgi:glycosyltransferase involved in cell wall biosynthesis